MNNTTYTTKNTNIPIWEKYTLNINEAVAYFGIGEKKLRYLIDNNLNADFLMFNGNKALIKRKKFEQYLDNTSAI